MEDSIHRLQEEKRLLLLQMEELQKKDRAITRELRQLHYVEPTDISITEAHEAIRLKMTEHQLEIANMLEEQADAVKRGDVPIRAKGLRFLEKEERRPMVALASYPRSGNSLLRSLVERITGVFTGSDSDPRRPLCKLLIESGLYGEGMVDSKVFAVKTHFPERLGRLPFKADRAVVIVRNPFDAIVSYFNMVLTETHVDSIEDEEYIKLWDMWDVFIREETEVWKVFHQHWRDVESRIPVLFVRFEDMLEHRFETYSKITKFILNTDTLQDTEYESLVRAAANTDIRDIGTYRPRGIHVTGEADGDIKYTQSGFPTLHLTMAPKSMKFYNDQQRGYILSSARSLLCHFGYWENFFENDGPGHVYPKSCLLLNKRKDGTYRVSLNCRKGVRAITKDDPFGRGFGKRWKSTLAALPPIKIKSQK